MEYVWAVLVNVYAVYLLCVAASTYMGVTVNHKTLLSRFVCPVGKHAAVETGTYYEIIVLFHDYICLHVGKMGSSIGTYIFGVQYAVLLRWQFHIVTVYVLEPCVRIVRSHERVSLKLYFRYRIQVSLK